MRTGFRYFRDHPSCAGTRCASCSPFFTTTAMVALLPVVPASQLDTTPGQFGMLAAGFGIGAVLAVWLLPRLRPLAGPDALVFGAAVVWSARRALVALDHVAAARRGWACCSPGPRRWPR